MVGSVAGGSEIDGEAFALPVAEARGLQSGGAAVLMGARRPSRFGPARVSFFEGAAGRRREGLSWRRAKGLERFGVARCQVGLDPQAIGVCMSQGGRFPIRNAGAF
jgi:hypothetical protein